MPHQHGAGQHVIEGAAAAIEEGPAKGQQPEQRPQDGRDGRARRPDQGQSTPEEDRGHRVAPQGAGQADRALGAIVAHHLHADGLHGQAPAAVAPEPAEVRAQQAEQVELEERARQPRFTVELGQRREGVAKEEEHAEQDDAIVDARHEAPPRRGGQGWCGRCRGGGMVRHGGMIA